MYYYIVAKINRRTGRIVEQLAPSFDTSREAREYLSSRKKNLRGTWTVVVVGGK